MRVPFNASGAVNPTHVELKTDDGTSNPFLALGALITAGMDGVKRKLPLPPNTDYNPGTASIRFGTGSPTPILPTKGLSNSCTMACHDVWNLYIRGCNVLPRAKPEEVHLHPRMYKFHTP